MEACMSSSEIFSIDTNKQPWERRELAEIGASFLAKLLVEDPETGMRVAKVCYKAGFTNTSHWHNCAHGMYVLDGVLVTSAGSFGPGNFVWFPEGTTMYSVKARPQHENSRRRSQSGYYSRG